MNNEEEKKEKDDTKDSIVGNSEAMLKSRIPIITRKESQDKSCLSVVLSGIGEYNEGNL